MKRLLAVLILGLLVVAALPAALAETERWDRSKAWELRKSGQVRVIHASPDAPAVDVWANGAPLFENAPFTGITPFKAVPAGSYNVQVVPAGATSPVVVDADLRLQRAREYTVVAAGTLDMIEPVVIEDRIQYTPKWRSKVRVGHFSPDAPAVDIAVKDGPVLIRDLEFQEVSDYLRLHPGTYDLEVRVAGTETVALELPDVTVDGGKRYTALAVGQLSENTLQALLTEDGKQFRFTRFGRH